MSVRPLLDWFTKLPLALRVVLLAAVPAVLALAIVFSGGDSPTSGSTDADSELAACAARWNLDGRKEHLSISLTAGGIRRSDRLRVSLYEGAPYYSNFGSAVSDADLATVRPGDCLVAPLDDGIVGGMWACSESRWITVGASGISGDERILKFKPTTVDQTNARAIPVGLNEADVAMDAGPQDAEPASCGDAASISSSGASTTTATEPAPPQEPQVSDEGIVGSWSGNATFRRSGDPTQTYAQAMEIESVEEGQPSGRATADYDDGFHCGGTISFVDGKDGNYLFDYHEVDNPENCSTTTQISVSLNEAGELEYTEISPADDFQIEGLLERAG